MDQSICTDGSDGSGKLPPQLLERVLGGLGFAEVPEPIFENLRAIYAAWCQRVPFDNVRKLIHVRAGNSGPLPGSTAEDFLEAWLKHGTGGTCWAGAGTFHALLASLGFDVARGVGTMLVAPDLPPNHGSVRVSSRRSALSGGLLDSPRRATAPGGRCGDADRASGVGRPLLHARWALACLVAAIAETGRLRMSPRALRRHTVASSRISTTRRVAGVPLTTRLRHESTVARALSVWPSAKRFRWRPIKVSVKE